MINCTFEDGGKASLRHVAVHAIIEKSGKILLEKRALRFLEGGKQELLSYRPGPKLKAISDGEKMKDLKLKAYVDRIAELAADLETLKKNENWLPEGLS